ncbi:MAG: nucleotidyltransferase domain-containing protein [Clostridia bacterium]|nr:nucleotidyltransferase domain-containing protein [Clostridia bacterium]
MDNLLKRKINIFLEQAEKICKVNFAYIFGSYARGEQTDNSDIDIAVMPDLSNNDKESELFMRGNMIELGKSIFKKDVDVVFLNIDSVLLKYEVVQEGIVIKDSDDRISFESLVIREYFDFKYYSDYYNNVMLESIKSKKSRSV